jgi:hypothetical protein
VICGFYEKLGFRAVGGNSRSFSILQNDTGTIGLFEGLFDKNILTFNPGWDRACATLPDYVDVRDTQRTLTSGAQECRFQLIEVRRPFNVLSTCQCAAIVGLKRPTA